MYASITLHNRHTSSFEAKEKRLDGICCKDLTPIRTIIYFVSPRAVAPLVSLLVALASLVDRMDSINITWLNCRHETQDLDTSAATLINVPRSSIYLGEVSNDEGLSISIGAGGCVVLAICIGGGGGGGIEVPVVPRGRGMPRFLASWRNEPWPSSGGGGGREGSAW